MMLTVVPYTLTILVPEPMGVSPAAGGRGTRLVSPKRGRINGFNDVNPRLCLNSTGLSAPREILIRFSSYLRMYYESITSMNCSTVVLLQSRG